GDRETGRPGDRETGRPGDRETGRPGDRETGEPGGRGYEGEARLRAGRGLAGGAGGVLGDDHG
ncbi:MAG: hypothetical protein ACLP5E_07240, partial [Streptosporangiaceae bacterium]